MSQQDSTHSSAAPEPKEWAAKIYSLLAECDHSWRERLTPRELMRKQSEQLADHFIRQFAAQCYRHAAAVAIEEKVELIGPGDETYNMATEHISDALLKLAAHLEEK